MALNWTYAVPSNLDSMQGCYGKLKRTCRDQRVSSKIGWRPEDLPLLIKSGRVILGLKKLKGKGKGAGGQVG